MIVSEQWSAPSHDHAAVEMVTEVTEVTELKHPQVLRLPCWGLDRLPAGGNMHTLIHSTDSRVESSSCGLLQIAGVCWKALKLQEYIRSHAEKAYLSVVAGSHGKSSNIICTSRQNTLTDTNIILVHLSSGLKNITSIIKRLMRPTIAVLSPEARTWALKTPAASLQGRSSLRGHRP